MRPLGSALPRPRGRARTGLRGEWTWGGGGGKEIRQRSRCACLMGDDPSPLHPTSHTELADVTGCRAGPLPV